MMLAKEIMTLHVITVSPDTPIAEALNLLADNDITGIPVCESDGKVIGILSEKDVLCLMQDGENAQGRKVSEFMTVPAITFDISENIHDICECLATYHFRRVPVTEGGKIVGIISRRDILRCIIHSRLAAAAR